MKIHSDLDLKVLEILDSYAINKSRLLAKPSVGTPGLVFADVLLINKVEPDPSAGSWIERRVVRTEVPQVFIWLFKKFVPVLSSLPDYGVHKEEIFGRLGNTIHMAESQNPPTTTDEQVASVVQDFWEICQDLVQGDFTSLPVALGADILDDFVSRSLKSDFVSAEFFKTSIWGDA
jgi:hypothetical protein